MNATSRRPPVALGRAAIAGLLGLVLLAGGCRPLWNPATPAEDAAPPAIAAADVALVAQYRSTGTQLIHLSDQAALFVLETLGTVRRLTGNLQTVGTLTVIAPGYEYEFDPVADPPGTLTVVDFRNRTVRLTFSQCDAMMSYWYPNYWRHAHGTLPGTLRARVEVPGRLDAVVEFTGSGAGPGGYWDNSAGCRLTGMYTPPAGAALELDTYTGWDSGEATESLEYLNAHLKGWARSGDVTVEFDEDQSTSSGSNPFDPSLPPSLASWQEANRSLIRRGADEFQLENLETAGTIGTYDTVEFLWGWQARGALSVAGEIEGLVQFAAPPVEHGTPPGLVFVPPVGGPVAFGSARPVREAFIFPRFFFGLQVPAEPVDAVTRSPRPPVSGPPGADRDRETRAYFPRFKSS